MKNNAFTVLVVLSGLTLAPSLPGAFGAQKANPGATTSFSVTLSSKPAQSTELNELKTIAAQAFETLTPATKQWVEATAEEYASKQPVGAPIDVAWAAKTIQAKLPSGIPGQLQDGMVAVLINSILKHALSDRALDRNFGRWMKEEALRAQGAKIDKQNRTIEQGQREARARYDQAMAAAERETWIGLMSALCATQQTGIGSFINKQPAAKCDDSQLQQAVIRKLRAQLVTLRTAKL